MTGDLSDERLRSPDEQSPDGSTLNGSSTGGDSTTADDATIDENVRKKQAGFTTKSSVEQLFIWRDSKEYNELFGSDTSFRESASVSYAISGILILLVAVLSPLHWALPPLGGTILWMIQAFLLGLAILTAIGVTLKYASARRSFLERVRVRKAASVSESLESLADTPTVSQLFRLNRKQLDEYHLLSVRQQKEAFRAAQLATVIAFAILILGALLAVRTQSEGQEFKTYVAGGLTALGALLSGFLARTFYKSYKETSDQLKLYYQEPWNTNQLLSVERITRTTPLPHDERLYTVWDQFLERLYGEWLLRRLDHEGGGANERGRSRSLRRGSTAAKAPVDNPKDRSGDENAAG